VPRNGLIDRTSWKILEALQENARLSFAELGRRVGLSTPAIAERVRRMEETGIIKGYHAVLDPAALGLPMLVFIRLTVASGENPLVRVVAAAKQLPEVIECHRVTGADSFILKVRVCSVTHLESFINHLTPLGATTTSTVLSSAIERQNISEQNIEKFHLLGF
jgi:Lrp/AsnC family leucine-responsive transcriptional regulator